MSSLSKLSCTGKSLTEGSLGASKLPGTFDYVSVGKGVLAAQSRAQGWFSGERLQAVGCAKAYKAVARVKETIKWTWRENQSR